MEDTLGALGLVLNCVTLWNTVYLDRALTQLRAAGYPALDADVARLSAYLRRHINIHGHYTVALPDLGGRHRVLRDPDQHDSGDEEELGQPTRTAGGMGLPGAGPSGHPERLPVGVCASGSQFPIMLKSRALHEHEHGCPVDPHAHLVKMLADLWDEFGRHRHRARCASLSHGQTLRFGRTRTALGVHPQQYPDPGLVGRSGQPCSMCGKVTAPRG